VTYTILADPFPTLHNRETTMNKELTSESNALTNAPGPESVTLKEWLSFLCLLPSDLLLHVMGRTYSSFVWGLRHHLFVS
jgi:hypothetical protein